MPEKMDLEGLQQAALCTPLAGQVLAQLDACFDRAACAVAARCAPSGKLDARRLDANQGACYELALAKADLPDTREAYPPLKRKFARKKIPLHLMSAATGEGVHDVLLALEAAVAAGVSATRSV